jgi:putative transposase
MSERLRFIARVEDGEDVAELAREFGISTKTAYKFLSRWKAEGVDGLKDRSHATRSNPQRTSPEVIEWLVAARREHPNWGALKLRTIVQGAHPDVKLPSCFTVHGWLKRNGLIQARKVRRTTPPSPTLLSTPTGPNDIWATDFKGQFRLGNGTLCYPLTATDLTSRFILACDALEGTDGDPVWHAFDQMFREYGLPRAIRTDNGPPFASRGLAGLSRLSVRWARLGIQHERIEPGCPQQNGQHERMHRTLKQETTSPARKNLLQQQERFDEFVEEFNHQRPHQALGQKPPATVYRRSERSYWGLPVLEYPLAHEVRTVRGTGAIHMPDGHHCHITQSLVGQDVGLREVDDGRWLVTFASIDLGHYDERDKSFVPMEAKSNKPSPIRP